MRDGLILGGDEFEVVIQVLIGVSVEVVLNLATQGDPVRFEILFEIVLDRLWDVVDKGFFE